MLGVSCFCASAVARVLRFFAGGILDVILLTVMTREKSIQKSWTCQLGTILVLARPRIKVSFEPRQYFGNQVVQRL